MFPPGRLVLGGLPGSSDQQVCEKHLGAGNFTLLTPLLTWKTCLIQPGQSNHLLRQEYQSNHWKPSMVAIDACAFERPCKVLLRSKQPGHPRGGTVMPGATNPRHRQGKQKLGGHQKVTSSWRQSSPGGSPEQTMQRAQTKDRVSALYLVCNDYQQGLLGRIPRRSFNGRCFGGLPRY